MTTYVPPDAEAPTVEVPAATAVPVPPVASEAEAHGDIVLPPERAVPPGPPAPPQRTDFRGPAPFEGDRLIPGVPRYRSTYLDYLPGIYRDSDFLGRFLLIFESVLGPIERTVGNVSHYFDPELTPPDFVAWLGSWLGLVLDERWPEARRRALIHSAVELYQWRGTRRGLSELVRLYTGLTPEILEPTLSEVSANRNRAFRFTIRLRVPPGTDLDRSLLESIIELEKPGFAACALEILGPESSAPGTSGPTPTSA